MQLTALLAGTPLSSVRGSLERDVTGLSYDSRKVQPGHAFFCIENNRKDGHGFAADAVARGAVAVIGERMLDVPVTMVAVPHAAKAMALAASHFHGDPSQRMQMVGVTGTNGKTTTTYLIERLLEAAGRRPGLIGTVEVRIGGECRTAQNTTPLSLELQALLGEMATAGHQSAVMEVSSHGLALDRVYGIPYDVGVFTNLTQDHLDFHGSMEAYFQAKLLLFLRLGENNPKSAPRGAALNADDAATARISPELRVPVLTYGVQHEAHVRARDIVTRFSGTRYTASTPRGDLNVQMRLVGMFNVYNSLAALTAGLLLDIPTETILSALAAMPPVRGRFELVDEGQPFSVVVDYAHTPDGLENVLSAARPMTEKRLIGVFGCGGDRDRTKRPIMGRIAGRLCDLAVITSDNPRTEDPERIVADIEAGTREVTDRYQLVVDRQTAIEQTLAAAEPGDVIVIAGKGHETYQIFRDRTIHFDDAEVARNWLRHQPAQGGAR
ncbi:MAG: UDP-N-acetylmuramoyl-L-alanyl-D-glutamate--2,6-diaminopimelate ligase [Candidatus Xenobia bacterium]